MGLSNENNGTTAVLLYHRLGWPKLQSLVAGQYVAPRLFRSQLSFLKAGGWKCISLSGVSHSGEGKGSGCLYCMTFDDGYLSVYEQACPALLEVGATATIYVVVDALGGINEWDRRSGDSVEPMMSISQMRELAEQGFTIGSHTLSHPRLPGLDDDQLRSELCDSRHKLEDMLGREVTSFSYPYGDYDDRVVRAAVDAGYTSAVSTRLGVVTGATDLLEIPRINVRWNALGPLLLRKIHRARRASGVSG